MEEAKLHLQRMREQLVERRRRAMAAAEEEYRKGMSAIGTLEVLLSAPALRLPSDPSEIPVESRLGRVGLTDAIREGVAAMQGRFTMREIAVFLQRNHPELGEVKKVTVSSTLAKMRMRGEIELVRSGIGRKPGLYHRPEVEQIANLRGMMAQEISSGGAMNQS